MKNVILHRWFRFLKITQTRGRAADGDESASKNEKLSTKPPSWRSCIYYMGRQYNATIMIRIKFTPCASRNGACRRRRTLRFGIESNLGSNPFGCVRECATHVCMYVTFLGSCPFKSIASASTCMRGDVRQRRCYALMEKCPRVFIMVKHNA